MPADVELTITDRDFTIATIAAPTIYTEPEEEEEGEEGEVSEEGAEGEEAAKGEAETQEGGAASGTHAGQDLCHHSPPGEGVCSTLKDFID